VLQFCGSLCVSTQLPLQSVSVPHGLDPPVPDELLVIMPPVPDELLVMPPVLPVPDELDDELAVPPCPPCPPVPDPPLPPQPIAACIATAVAAQVSHKRKFIQVLLVPRTHRDLPSRRRVPTLRIGDHTLLERLA
jgi:hypothetical protein